jgi:RNA polymerase sigma factor (sigma-70 family)
MALLRLLRESGATRFDEAQNRLLALYWKPVYCMIRRLWGKGNEEAKDLAQEFFTRIVLEGSLVQKYDRQRGSFRVFVKAAVGNFMRDVAKSARRQKRGGDAKMLSFQIEDEDLAAIEPEDSGLSPEEAFDEAWRGLVIDRAFELMKRRLAKEGKEVYFEVFSRYDLETAGPEISYKIIGDELGLDAHSVKNYLTRARDEYKRAVTDVISEYVEGEEEIGRELRDLLEI